MMLKLKHIYVIFDKKSEKLLNMAIFVVYHPKYWGNVDFCLLEGWNIEKKRKSESR